MEGLSIPDEKIFGLPEKVIQFGTGVLLRGLPDYFIDKANRQGLFNGRIVIVKSTSSGGTDDFAEQDGLYTVFVKGIEAGHSIDETIINSSISRVLSAVGQWADILKCAHDPAMQVVISNTTEVGITLVKESIAGNPPHSYPAKLLAFLHERFKTLGGSDESGMVIIPTELIPDNANKLRSILLELAGFNSLEEDFIKWLIEKNHFCNSLVDRIVPGMLPAEDRAAAEKKLGYTDNLMIMTESFRLWAIESGDKRVEKILSFSTADSGVVIAPDIEKFRELKVRLLNGSHSFSCDLSCLVGISTVKEAMTDEYLSAYIQELCLTEIVAAITNDKITKKEASDFATSVLDRFRNPALDHKWLSISVQFSSKMKMRNIPLLLRHYSKTDKVPVLMALGFAAYLLFMRSTRDNNGRYIGRNDGTEYQIQDDHADYFEGKWAGNNIDDVVEKVLGDKNFWGTDLLRLNGFAEAVKNDLSSLVNDGVLSTILKKQVNKISVE